MIVVIADDLTGAAELAGIGLRYNLHVEMSTIVDQDAKAELLVIATDTRSIKEDDAIIEIEKITRQVMLLQPGLIYKKIDSVLRGHVISELIAQLKVLNLDRALVIAGNPSLGRTISGGNYFYNDQPIHLSSFSNDPEFAITSSDVLEMLRVRDENVQVKKNDDELPGHGIVVGEVKNNVDLKAWAKRIDKKIFLVGASGFFSAVLDEIDIKGGIAKEFKAKQFELPILFVCGSTFNKSRNAIKEIKRKGGPVSYMPADVLTSEDFDSKIYKAWSNEIVAFINSKGKAIISIDPASVPGAIVSAGMLREKTAMVVSEVFKQVNIHELFIEGGSTAAAVIRRLELQTFIPIEELAPGVVRMKIKGQDSLCITVKPGSYQWPGEVWDFD